MPTTAAAPARQRSDPAVSARAAARIMSKRRRRIWRNIIFFIVATVAMVVLALLNRDHQDVMQSQRVMAYVLAECQAAATRSLPPNLPSSMPKPPSITDAEWFGHEEGEGRLRNRFLYLPANAGRASPAQPLVVCCDDPAVHLLLRADGRHVVLFDGRAFQMRWMDEPEFSARSAALGVHVSEKP